MALSSTTSLEAELDDICFRYELTVIKEQNVTGNSYTLMTQRDAWIYLLNNWSEEGKRH
jgi:hypothetical protein